MQQKLIVNEGRDRLLIIFAGWGMDDAPFAPLRHHAYDIMVVWDYRTPGFDLSQTCHYREICMLAWSFGVIGSMSVLPKLAPRLTRCIAINGTLHPVDEHLGIPPDIFYATLSGLSERSLNKFYRRMCGGAASFRVFAQSMPRRDVAELADELRAIASAKTVDDGFFDLAIVSDADAIIPASNQLRAWQSTPTIKISGSHLPDFQHIIDKYLIDKPLVSRRFGDAVGAYDSNAPVQLQMAERLWQTMVSLGHDATIAHASRIIEIGCGSGLFTTIYSPSVGDADWQLWDIADLPPALLPNDARFLRCDAEMAVRQLQSESVDCILSNCALQWFGSPGRFLTECQRVLRKGGFIALSTFADDNMPELGSALSCPSADEWRTMVPDQLKLQVLDCYTTQLTFDSPRQVLSHIRATGANALSRAAWSPSRLAAFADNYPRTPDGKCRLTYRPILIILTK